MKSILVIGANGYTAKILIQKLTSANFKVSTYTGKDFSLDYNLSTLKDYSVICNAASGLSDADYELLKTTETPVVDLSPEFRTNPNWFYGQTEAIDYEKPFENNKITNPGCFSQAGCILLWPAISLGWIDDESVVCLQGIGGYTSLGNKGVEQIEKGEFHSHVHSLVRPHPHVNEIKVRTGFKGTLVFNPVSAQFPKGTYVSVVVSSKRLENKNVLEELKKFYAHGKINIEQMPAKLQLDSYQDKEGGTLYVQTVSNTCVQLAFHMDNILKGCASTAFENIKRLVDLPAV